MSSAGYGYGYRDWGDATFGSGWSDCTATTSAGGGYPGSTSIGGGFPGSTSISGGYPGSTSISGGYLGSTSISGGYPDLTLCGGGYFGSTSISGGYPVSTSISGGYPGSTSLGDGTVTTSMGDTSRIDHLLGLADNEYQDEYWGREKATISLPEELTQLFQRRECKLCDILLTSELTAYTHYEGKVHEKAVAAYMMNRYSIKGSLRKGRSRFHPVFCDVCKTTLTSRIVHDTHFAGKTHAKNMKKLVFQSAEPQMEDDVDFMFQPPPPPPPPKLNEFVCDVCRISTNTENQLILHKQGSKHRRKLRELERLAEEANDGQYDDEMGNEKYYDNTKDYMSEEEEDEEDCDKGPVEHVEDPTMDQPLQFGSGTPADSRTVIRSEGNVAIQTAEPNDEEIESSKLWDYIVELMHSDRAKETAEPPGKEDNPGSESRSEMDDKVNPGAAPVLHKYKSALEAQKGDMITMVIPPDKSRIVKVEPKKPLYLLPEIRSQIGVAQQSVQVKDATGVGKSAVGVINNSNKCSGSVDILESPWKPYYNPNVDFHRRKSPSPEGSSVGREGYQNRRWQRYGSYGWGSQGYRRARKRGCWIRGYDGDSWGRDEARRYDERNNDWAEETRWYRGRLPQEQAYSIIRNGKRYGEDRNLHEESARGRHKGRIKSRTPESRYGWRHDESRRRVAAEGILRESSCESTGSSSRSLRTRTSNSKSARGSESEESSCSSGKWESSKTRSPKRIRYGRSRRSDRSRSRSRCSGDVQKYGSSSGSPRLPSTSSQKRKRSKRERSWSDEGKKKNASCKKDKSRRKKTKPKESREQSEGRSRSPSEDVKVKEEVPIRLRDDLPQSFPRPIPPVFDS